MSVRTITLHTCDNCGKEAEWDGDWAWYGSIFAEEWGHMVNSCSDKCRDEIGDPEEAFKKRYGRGSGSNYYK